MAYKRTKAVVVDFTEAMVRNRKLGRGSRPEANWATDASSCY